MPVMAQTKVSRVAPFLFQPTTASAAEENFPLRDYPYVCNIVPRRRCASQLRRSFPASLLIVFSFPLHVGGCRHYSMASIVPTASIPPGETMSAIKLRVKTSGKISNSNKSKTKLCLFSLMCSRMFNVKVFN